MNDRSATRSERAIPIRPVRLERMEEDPKSALLAKLMDTVFVIPGTKIRFGFDALIGLFPGIGDSVGAIISTFIIAQGSRMGVPRIILARMAMHILINTLVGAVPVFGDMFSVFYRSNVKNYELLRRYAGQRRSPRASDWLFVIGFAVLMLAIVAAVIAVAVMIVRKVVQWF